MSLPIVMEAPGIVMRGQKDWGGMTVGYNQLPGGADFTPFLEGLENDRCHCPHWGYILEGSVKLVYNDGRPKRSIKQAIFFIGPPGILPSYWKTQN